MEQVITMSLTGHRPKSLGGYDETNPFNVKIKEIVKLHLRHAYEKHSVKRVIVGMAQGLDIWGGEAVMQLKSEGCDMELWAAIPWWGQKEKWPGPAVYRWFELGVGADKRMLVNGGRWIEKEEWVSRALEAHPSIEESTAVKLLDNRNRWMVDESQIVWALWNDLPSGTGKAVKYAIDQKRMVVCLNPFTETTRVIKPEDCIYKKGEQVE